MTDREALTAALEAIENWTKGKDYLPPWTLALAAARERLAQLPPYPAELVERKALVLLEADLVPTLDLARQIVIAVLDALNRETGT